MNRSLQSIRADFPILNVQVNNRPLVYFDNAATTQKPLKVIDAISDYYKYNNSNVHRGVHTLSQEATTLFEESRAKIASFIKADSCELIFTRGTTESINLITSTFGEMVVGEGDEVLITALEHHSNFVPWQQLCSRKKAILKIVPINEKGEVETEVLAEMLTERTKVVSVCHISNALGTIPDVRAIIRLAHNKGIPVVIDGAQGFSHEPVNVKELDCDFYAFSAHKAYGPMGIGGLYGKKELLEKMPPYHFGGEMISKVTPEWSTFNELPFKFEAGTPNVADTVGFAAACDYLNEIGWDFILKQEKKLLEYATQKLSEIEGVKLIGTAAEKASIISFLIGDLHFFDAGTILDQLGIAVRTGVHCTEPRMKFLKIQGTVRASFAFYNTKEEIDILTNGIKRAISMLI